MCVDINLRVSSIDKFELFRKIVWYSFKCSNTIYHIMADEYLASSTIHGLRYLSKSEHLASRLIWASIVGCFVCAASFWIYESSVSWDHSPYV